jgi:hypothetical protein
MLPGVHEEARQVSPVEFVEQRHDLHEIRPCTGNHDNRPRR